MPHRRPRRSKTRRLGKLIRPVAGRLGRPVVSAWDSRTSIVKMMKAKKSLGQHWLDDRQILDSICETSGVQANDDVLEIGPGHGSLTNILIKKGAHVTAVELDAELADKLKDIKSENFRIINQDILEFDLSSMPQGYKVVANIPYYLTSNLIRNLSESPNPPASITLLVQKEVAERICAKPGDMSILSVSSQAYYECSLGIIVPAEKFDPPPKVDSQVVHMTRRKVTLLSGLDKKDFFRVVKAGFSNRRKTLQNSLAGGLHIEKTEAETVLKKSGIDPSSRPQELSLDAWLSLAKNV